MMKMNTFEIRAGNVLNKTKRNRNKEVLKILLVHLLS